MKSVRFSDKNEIFLIPAVPDVRKIIVPERNPHSYSEAELKIEIERRKHDVWKQAIDKYAKLLYQYEDLKKCISEAEEDDEDDLELFNEMMCLNLINQELYTSQMIYLKMM